MKAVIQRVDGAKLSVEGKLISEIKKGLCVYYCAEAGDKSASADYMAKKIASMRIFSDENGKMNLSVKDVGGSILVISQFTLCGDTSHGNRPSFSTAMPAAEAEKEYLRFAELLRTNGVADVQTGVFGADMHIEQYNDGPVTIIMERYEPDQVYTG